MKGFCIQRLSWVQILRGSRVKWRFLHTVLVHLLNSHVCLHLYSVQMEVRGIFVGVWFHFCHVSPQNRTHIIAPDGKRLHPLSHPSILYRQRREPSGEGRNLEDPATVKSRARQGSQTPRFWIKPSCICSRGERRKSFCVFLQPFCYFQASETTYLRLQHPHRFRLRLFMSRGPTEPHSSCSPPHHLSVARPGLTHCREGRTNRRCVLISATRRVQ